MGVGGDLAAFPGLNGETLGQPAWVLRPGTKEIVSGRKWEYTRA
jgi:hypothetical protein